jgi:hypothetical protein
MHIHFEFTTYDESPRKSEFYGTESSFRVQNSHRTPLIKSVQPVSLITPYLLMSILILSSHPYLERGRGSVVGTMLESGQSRVRFPMTVFNFLNLSNPSSRTMALGSTQEK